MTTARPRSLTLVLSLLIASPAATAPPPGAPLPAAAANRVYLPADFVQFAPKTALDMLERVPGFTIRREDTERGLGVATGNVLVNGRRISGKANDVVTALSRIPARDVERIEIVDAATLNVPGLSGQVANVLVQATGLSGQFGYYPELRRYYTDPRLTSFDLAVKGSRGRVEYTLGLDNRANRSGAGGPTSIFGAEGQLLESRDERWRGNSENPRASGAFAFDGPGSSTGNVNVSYRRVLFDFLETGRRAGSGLPERHRRVTVDQDGAVYEVGGDWELGLGPGRLKLITVNTVADVPSDTLVLTTFDHGLRSGNRFSRTAVEREAIARGEYRWTSGGAEWQLAAEAAFNRLDNTSNLFTLEADDSWSEIPLPGGTARVEEDRYELVGSFGRSLGNDLALNVSLGGEHSEISARGRTGARELTRPKGEISLAWKASPVTDLNVKLARRVGQLDFYDFLASVDLRDDTQTAANPNLVPQQSWNLEAEGARDLGDLGTTSLRLYARWIDDIIDYIPIGETGEAPGNLDHAIVWGVRSVSTLELGRLGWRGARLDLSLQHESSELEDPLTGEKRPISGSLDWAGNAALRHDVPGTEWAWGGGASYSYYARDYRLSEVGRLWEGPVWGNLYLEHKNVGGLTVRGGIYNLFGADSMWDRTVHAGRRTDEIAFVEQRDRRIGPIFSFSMRGKF
jgi:outer membrane receptor for ferrienterochelin and colicins